ncbi:MAG: hypothetical protein SGJ01_06675 [Gemmatimonadota bacterium]|nr:hypothetical protein [Gemmatimonadota bacterium]
MSLARWDEMLTPLTSPADAKLRLEDIQKWALSGIVTTAQASAATRTVEIWLRAEVSELDRQKLRELEQKTIDLAQELKKARSGIRVA